MENDSEVLTKEALLGALEFRNHPDKLDVVFIPLCVQLQHFSNAVCLAVQIFGVLEM